MYKYAPRAMPGDNSHVLWVGNPLPCPARYRYLLFNKIMPYPMLLALAGSLQFALFDEFVVQARTSGRAAEWADIVTDFSGAIFGALMFLSLWFVVRFIIKMIKRKS